MERTFLMVKPDGVSRGLVGEIITAYERAGFRIVGLKMLKPNRDTVSRHYPDSESWLSAVGQKTIEGYAAISRSVKAELGTDDPASIGRIVKGWLVEFITSDNVVAMVLEGNMAVKNGRRICGNTIPILADPGSIRGRYSLDSPDAANAEHRPVYNLIHASGNVEEAEFEIGLWFPELARS